MSRSEEKSLTNVTPVEIIEVEEEAVTAEVFEDPRNSRAARDRISQNLYKVLRFKSNLLTGLVMVWRRHEDKYTTELEVRFELNGEEVVINSEVRLDYMLASPQKLADDIIEAVGELVKEEVVKRLSADIGFGVLRAK